MKVGLVAGESSGDLLGAGLIRALKAHYPEARFEGVAGPAMLAAGCEQWQPADSLAVFGFVEPLRQLPGLLKLRRQLVQRWRRSPPDVFVGIDAPAFNLGLEKKLRRARVKTVHYVSPSIWAWRPGRINTVRAAADTVLCILPFEKALYDSVGVEATFIGHPRADQVPTCPDMLAARAALGLDAVEVVAILPGSRRSEISRLGEALVAVASIIHASRRSVQFVTPVATPALRPEIESKIAAAGLTDRFLLLDGNAETAMIAADVVLLASGTAALESALLAKPTVAAYRLGRISYNIFRRLNLVKLTHYTPPNLLTETPLVPEFIQDDALAVDIAAAVAGLLDDPERRRFIGDRFARLRVELALNADQRAAAAVVALLS